MSKIWSTVWTVVMALVCALVYYLALPAVTFTSVGFWFYMLLCLACVAVSLSMFCYDTKAEKVVKFSWIGVGAFAVVFLVLGITSTMLFHANHAKEVADVTVSEVSIEESFPDLKERSNQNNLPLVDLDTANMLGDRKIAGLDHASWYDVDDEYNLITYQGKYYRLSVIDYGGYMKYRKAKDAGLPGYVLVEVTPKNGEVTQDASVVKLDQPIRYSPGAYWNYDLRRHLRWQFPSYIFDESYLEIDEEGVPYWVTGILRPTCCVFGTKTVTSFIVTNAQTGESHEYSIDEAPEWIDHIFSLRYLMDIANWHYAYVNGFFNFSRTNVWRTSYYYRDQHQNDSESEAGKFANFYGYSSFVDNDGQVLFYTGLTADNKAESNLGWLTIDISTGKMIQYNVVGAEESSAQKSVEELVQAQKYEATFPLPANIGGHPSYVMCLKGKAGLTQGYAICNVDNYSIAVQAETLDKAISQYLRKLGEAPDDDTTPEPNTPPVAPSHETTQATGTIEAIYTAEINGTTQFYYVIDGDLYRAAITVNQYQVTYKVGDTVIFGYYDGGELLEIVGISLKD